MRLAQCYVAIMAAVGVSTPRRDSGPKVRGATRFAADIAVPGLLHARLVLSHEAHAMISSIGTDAALAVPGVVAVLTAADLPLAATGRGRTYEPLAREEVVYAGHPVALVVAESEAAAEDGAELVEVDLDPLEPVLDLESATRPGAPRARVKVAADDAGSDLGDAHASVATSGVGDEEELSDNVLDTARLENGDVDAALAASHVVVKGRLSTPWMYQGYIEPQTATAWVDPDGQLVVSSATQAPFSTRDSLAKLLGMPVGQVRVRSEALGGAFGGKIMVIDPLVACAAVVLRRPVRLAMTRSEDMAASNPAGAEMLSVELGADAEGNLTGIRTRILVDRGSTDDFGVESIAALLSAGPYRWRAHQLTALGVSTNRMTFGAYRAPTAPPAAFAVESKIDELARRLNMDPLDLRLRNVVGEGDANPAGQPFPIFGARQCLERIREQPLWSRRQTLPDGEGIGAAIGWWPGGDEPAAAVCRLDADGNLTIITGAADMSGVESGFATIAAEAFGVDPTIAPPGSTPRAPRMPGTSGVKKVTYTVGRAVERAASEARERLLEIAAEELEIAPEGLKIVDGAIQPARRARQGAADRRAGAQDPRASAVGSPRRSRAMGASPCRLAPQSAAHLSHVRVDPDTGAVTLLAHVVAQDVGRALNPALVDAHHRQAAPRRASAGLCSKSSAHDSHGQLTTGTFVNYALPTAGGRATDRHRDRQGLGARGTSLLQGRR